MEEESQEGEESTRGKRRMARRRMRGGQGRRGRTMEEKVRQRKRGEEERQWPNGDVRGEVKMDKN